MQVKFYTVTSHPNTIGKSFSGTSDKITIKPYEPIDALNGYIIVDKDNEIWNYCVLFHDALFPGMPTGTPPVSPMYSNEVIKMYFIVDKEYLPGGNVRLKLHEDVLETYKEQILSLPAIIGRTQSGYINANIASDLPTEQYHTNELRYFDYKPDDVTPTATYKNYEFQFSPDKLILVTSGGVFVD